MNLPLIKENRIEMMIQNMQCMDKYPFDRDSQRECILALYPGKDEKSVFRGMVIPSLRHLGLIIGYGDLIRLSGNGKLILEAKKVSCSEKRRALRAIFLEIDKRSFQFIAGIRKMHKGAGVEIGNFMEKVIFNIDTKDSTKQKEERAGKWLKILEQCEMIKRNRGFIYLKKENLNIAEEDLRYREKLSGFGQVLFEVYFSISGARAGIVDITDLREKLAVRIYEERKEIITEHQFDQLLRSLPLVTDNYIISLGHPMGAEEKLFSYNNNYYRTLSITEFKRGD